MSQQILDGKTKLLNSVEFAKRLADVANIALNALGTKQN
jgi:hypothetical protein